MAGTPTTRLTRSRAALSVPSAWALATALFFAAMLAFYFWTAATSIPMSFKPASGGYFGMLADALRHGELALRMKPPQGLLDLPNPYDPVANAQYRFAGLDDLSLRNGHLYAYWGPTAAIVLFAPLQALGIDVSQSFAVAFFGFLGFVFSVAIVRFLVRKFLPDTPRWVMAVACVALAFGNTVPFILRRPSTHEVASTCGLCFGMLGIWLLLMGWHGARPSARKLLAAGVALGLAMFSRPTLGALALIPLVLVVAAWRGKAWPQGLTGRRVLAALFGPLVVCGVLIMAYNIARFGSPMEFGVKFQLNGDDGTEGRTFVPAYIQSRLYNYLLAPPRPTALFPFLRLDPPNLPWRAPSGFDAIDPTAGALVLAPVVWWLFLLPVLRRRAEPELRRLLWAMAGTGAVIVLGISCFTWGTTQHYAADFMSLFIMSALLVWMVFLSRVRRGSWRRRLVVGGGLLTVAWGSAVGLAMGLVGYQNRLEVNHPALFHRLEDLFSPVSVVQTRIVGRPVVGNIISPGDRPVTKVAWGSLGQSDDANFYVSVDPSSVTFVAPRKGTYHLRGLFGIAANGVSEVPTIMTVKMGKSSWQLTAGAPQYFDVPVTLKAGITRTVWTASAGKLTDQAALLVQGLSIDGPD
jgi:hypothetical protein